MDTKHLTEAILDGGIRSINFFNGRLLSGEDMSQEHAAHSAGRRRLGQAIGTGIAFGLEVSETLGRSTTAAPVVTVTAGLAINRRGETLVLPATVDVSLVHPVPPSPPTPASTFHACDALPAGDYSAGTGVYLLTIAPASGSEGRAPVSGLSNTTASCNTRYTVEGVQFRRINLEVSQDDLNDSNRLHNRIAYRCFGVTDRQSFLRNPFGPPFPRDGLLDDLRPNRLTDRDVPLAVLHWTTTDGIKFVDLWSVRRRLTCPATTTRWSPFVDDWRVREGEAMFLQFQDAIETWRDPGALPEAVVATQYFSYLPAVGILPLAGIKSSRGFNHRKFFENLTYQRPVYVEGHKVTLLLRDSFAAPPIDLSNKELIWLYMVRENIQGIDNSSTSIPQAFLIFASGQLPYRGDAHYDLAYFDYANYA
jgi:hypothetical protein